MPDEELARRVAKLEEQLLGQRSDIAFLKTLLDIVIQRVGSENDDFIRKLITDMDEIHMGVPDLRRLWAGYIDTLKRSG